ncbi:multidrug DMT transporter permease [Maribellus comscasis]|uniref:Multidrug DMT transporter permease n=1 Tax=Maribellus comscasis TaxID=2681766 RepID=A0A6I6JYC1_9BACT|nr:GRP family sugar transporter [Maribellus comscasis]QGY47541.1 multidrug DMT transporter permease [Maribellus comscasis]
MFIIDSYQLAVVFCLITMLCWGSWANSAKCTSPKWQFPLYYWDYSIGLILTALLFGLTMGSFGTEGRSFIADLRQADFASLTYTFIGGVIFNLSNLLIVAAITIAGLSVAFPIAVGLALVLGVLLNYLKVPTGNLLLLFAGVLLVVIAMVVDALASRKAESSKGKASTRGIILSVISGIIMSFFYRFVTEGMTMDFTHPEPGKLTPYSAVLVFSVGLFLSNFVWNTFFMYKPITGTPVSYKQYFTNGTTRQHAIGILGGIIFNIGFLFNLIAAEKAGPAISYGLGQGSTMIGAAWGVFWFKEFSGAPKSVNKYLAAMFILFIAGLGMIIMARVN